METPDDNKAKEVEIKGKIAKAQADLKGLTTSAETYNKLKSVSNNLDKYLTSAGDSKNDGKATKEKTEAEKKATEAQKALTQATKQSTNANKDYENSLASLDEQMQKLEVNQSKLDEGSQAYRNGISAKAGIIQKEIDLTKKSIVVNTQNANVLERLARNANKENDNIKGTTGESTIDSGSDNLLSKVASEKQKIIELQKQLTDIPYQILESKLTEFDHRVNMASKRMSILKNELEITTDAKTGNRLNSEILSDGFIAQVLRGQPSV